MISKVIDLKIWAASETTHTHFCLFPDLSRLLPSAEHSLVVTACRAWSMLAKEQAPLCPRKSKEGQRPTLVAMQTDSFLPSLPVPHVTGTLGYGLPSLPERFILVPLLSPLRVLIRVTVSCLTLFLTKSGTVQTPVLPFSSHTSNHPEVAGNAEQRDGLGRIQLLPVGNLLTMLVCWNT